MSLASGTVEYTLGTPPVTGCGVSWTADEMDTALAGPVALESTMQVFLTRCEH